MFNEKGKTTQRRRFSKRLLGYFFCGVSLLLPSLSFALCLGDMILKSSYNEQLNAEIRLMQFQDLSESDILVNLASREEFARIGLDRDFFLTDLKFSVSLDNPNNPHIKITSTKPVEEPYLNFLIDAQWPSGRLLREYKVMHDLPIFEADAIPIPVVEAPVVNTPNLEVLSVESPVVETQPVLEAPKRVVRQISEKKEPETIARVSDSTTTTFNDGQLASNSSSKFSTVNDAADSFLKTLSRQAAERKSSLQIQAPPKRQVTAGKTLPKEVVREIRQILLKSIASARSAALTPEPTPAPQSQARVASLAPKSDVLVADGDTLWRIASQLRPSSSVSVQQTMLALQEANPEAFIDNNINLLKKGKVLRAPTLEEIQRTSFRQAVAVVKQQTQDWQQRTQPSVLSALEPQALAPQVSTKQKGHLTIGPAE